MPAPDSAFAPSQPGRLPSGSVRRFGPYLLLNLLGRSSLTLAWQAQDTRQRQPVLLMLPREAPIDGAVVERCVEFCRRVARVEHPALLSAAEQGRHDIWPFIAHVLPAGASTLQDQFDQRGPLPLVEVVGWCIDLLEGLAQLHDGGLAHGDIGLHSVLIDRHGRALAWGGGLSVALHGRDGRTGDPDSLRTQREAADRDLQAVGLLLYRLVAMSPAFDEADFPRAAARLGSEIIRLPWTLPQPVPEALRAIINRALDRHPQRRYLGTRSLARALEGWRQVQSTERGGPLALLVDRLGSLGHLPARPGLAERVHEIVRMQTQRLDDLADVILEDPALSFELLRQVNAVPLGRAGEGGVATVRRAVQLVGLRGVRRAAGGLRTWPGPLETEPAQALDRVIRRACLGGHIAEFLTPAGLDAEAALLAAQLQHLGRMLVRYHFPDEAAQIANLMQPTAAPRAGEPATPGLSEAGAAMAVLGVDLPSLAQALARHWGLNEGLQAMMQPLPVQQPVHTPTSADAWVRLVASCANEALEALLNASAESRDRQAARVAGRYARSLGVTVDSLKETFARAREKLADHLKVPPPDRS